MASIVPMGMDIMEGVKKASPANPHLSLTLWANLLSNILLGLCSRFGKYLTLNL